MITKKNVVALTLTLLIVGSGIATFLVNSQKDDVAIDRNTCSKTVYNV